MTKLRQTFISLGCIIIGLAIIGGGSLVQGAWVDGPNYHPEMEPDCGIFEIFIG